MRAERVGGPGGSQQGCPGTGASFVLASLAPSSGSCPLPQFPHLEREVCAPVKSWRSIPGLNWGGGTQGFQPPGNIFIGKLGQCQLPGPPRGLVVCYAPLLQTSLGGEKAFWKFDTFFLVYKDVFFPPVFKRTKPPPSFLQQESLFSRDDTKYIRQTNVRGY